MSLNCTAWAARFHRARELLHCCSWSSPSLWVMWRLEGSVQGAIPGPSLQLGTQGGTGSASLSRAPHGRKEGNKEHPAHIIYSSCQGMHQCDRTELVWWKDSLCLRNIPEYNSLKNNEQKGDLRKPATFHLMTVFAGSAKKEQLLLLPRE